MKQFTTLLIAILITTATFAQKKELKTAAKALDNNQYTEALNILNSVSATINEAKTKYQTKYYFLLGKAYYANGTTPDTFEKAANAFKTLFDLEKSGTAKYTNDATMLLNTMVKRVADQGTESYNKAITLSKAAETKEQSKVAFASAAKDFEKVQLLSATDTAFLQNSALAYFFAEKYEKSVNNYQKLLDMGYTGVSTTYTATSVVNGQPVSFPSEKEMNKQVKMKLATDPKVNVRESQRNGIIKMIAKNYIAMEDNEKALAAIKEAQKVSPQDYGLLVDEANVYFAMDKKDMFKQKLEEAVKINPSDPVLHYNIGVMKMDLKDNEGAIASFQKAIELDPNYKDAYNNIGAAVLAKAEPIVEEMNANLSNFDKYDKLQAKQMEIYKEALPYYEKVYKMDGQNISVIQTLMGIYENLEMYDKAKEVREVYKTLK
jgi:tetratricopeptide (TPR) repeat protein